MQNSPAEIVRQLLIDLNLGIFPIAGSPLPWQAFVSGEPPSPDNCITVYDTAGTGDGRSMIDGEPFGHYGFQVRVRSKDYKTGWQKADAILTAMSAVLRRKVTVNSDVFFVQAITHISDIIPLGKEPSISKRNLFTINATVPIP